MKLAPFFPICLGLIASGSANCQISVPSVGYVRYANDGVRGIYGLEGNYVVGRSVLAQAGAASFSDSGGLLLQSGSLALVDANLTPVSNTELQDSDAVMRLDGSLETAIAWLPASGALVHWNGQSFVRTAVPEISAVDTVTSVRKIDADTASLFVVKPDTSVVRYQISLRTGNVKSSLPLPIACQFAFEDGAGVLCFKDRKLSVLSYTGETLQTFPLPADGGLLIEQASRDALHLSTKTPGQDWLLHLAGNDRHLYQLPAPRKAASLADGVKPESAK